MTNPSSPTTSLTGLLTRDAFDQTLASQLEKTQHEDRSLALAFMDLDRFMDVNDSLGHEAGDAVLATVAGLIRECIGPDVVVGRYGGDEFALLFPYTEREQAFLVLERIRAAVHSQTTFSHADNAVELKTTISSGLAAYPVDARNENELIRKADQALYRAKQSGANRVRLAYEERMVPKTTHYTKTQLERLSRLAESENVNESELLREALDHLLLKYGLTEIETSVVRRRHPLA